MPTRHSLAPTTFEAAFQRPFALVALAGEQDVVIAIDTMVLGTHFLEDTDPSDLGHKALAVNLSDLAAMGARPMRAVVSLTRPTLERQWNQRFEAGFMTLASAHDVNLAAAVQTRGHLSVTVQVYGLVPPDEAITRAGARPGDQIFVTGTLGDASLGLALLRGEDDLLPAGQTDFRGRLARPTPRVAGGMAARGLASAAIDISDGFAADLGHILESSHVGATVRVDRLPLSPAMADALAPERAWRHALSGGDDYELCLTCPPRDAPELLRRVTAAGCPITRVGEIESTPGLRLTHPDRRNLVIDPGFQHFA